MYIGLNRYFIMEHFQVVNEHIKTCPTSLLIRVILFRTTAGHHCIPTRMAKSKGPEYQVLAQMHNSYNPHTLFMGVPLWKNCLAFSTEVKYMLVLTPSNSVTRCRPKGNEKICTRICVTVLFKVGKTWGECPSTEEWVLCGVDTQWSITWKEKLVNYWYMQLHGWILKNSVKEAKCKRIHTFR